LTRQLRASLPDEGEVAGLLALMLLTDARRGARTGPDGALIPLADQDRSRWDQAAIADGVAILEATLPVAKPGRYQLQAAIAAVHDEAADLDSTDWRQILALYDVLAALAPGPMVALNRTVAVAMVRGPAAALAELDDAAADPALRGHHRVDAVRAHLLDELGDREAARKHYLRAAQRTRSLPEQRYLLSRATR
jgi:predicted RNA polymerase sigma factor